MTDSIPPLYGELASWFHLLTAPGEYAEESAFYSRLMREEAGGPIRTVLELGSGGGNNASHMKAWFEMTLTDVSEPMLELSRGINPELEHLQGDMRSLRLGREFDAVFVHDAVVYMTTEDDLRAAVETATAHCRTGGAVLFAPDYVRETFRESVEDGGHDGEDGRGLRYLVWTRDPDPSDTTYVVDYVCLLREADGTVRATHDQHVEGLFQRETWLGILGEAGVDAQSVPLEHSDVEPGVHEVFVGRRTARHD